MAVKTLKAVVISMKNQYIKDINAKANKVGVK